MFAMVLLIGSVAFGRLKTDFNSNAIPEFNPAGMTRLDRLDRSLVELLETVEALKARGIYLAAPGTAPAKGFCLEGRAAAASPD